MSCGQNRGSKSQFLNTYRDKMYFFVSDIVSRLIRFINLDEDDVTRQWKKLLCKLNPCKLYYFILQRKKIRTFICLMRCQSSCDGVMWLWHTCHKTRLIYKHVQCHLAIINVSRFKLLVTRRRPSVLVGDEVRKVYEKGKKI